MLQCEFLLNIHFCVYIDLKHIKEKADLSYLIWLIFKQLSVPPGDFIKLTSFGPHQPAELVVMFIAVRQIGKLSYARVLQLRNIHLYRFYILGLHEICF